MMYKDGHDDITLDTVVAIVRDIMLVQGTHQTSVLVCGDNGVVLGALGDLPPGFEEREQHLFSAGFLLSEKTDLGPLEQAFFISEGWMSIIEDLQVEVIPSEDPQRLEVLMIAGIDFQSNIHSMLIMEMIRHVDSGALIGLEERTRHDSRDGQVHSPLLDAFVAGYAAGKEAGVGQFVH